MSMCVFDADMLARQCFKVSLGVSETHDLMCIYVFFIVYVFLLVLYIVFRSVKTCFYFFSVSQAVDLFISLYRFVLLRMCLSLFSDLMCICICLFHVVPIGVVCLYHCLSHPV